MKEDWDYKKLSLVCSKITDGSHFSPKVDENGIYPMLSVKDMMAIGFNYTTCKYINENDYNVLVANGCKPKVNDVLVAKDGSYLKTAFVLKEDKEQVLLSSIAIITPRLDEIVPEYLAFYFKAPHTKSVVEKHYLTGTAIKRVILKGFKTITIPVPPLSEQQHIVEELDLLSSIIEKKKAQLIELDNLAQSLFYEMFGDPITNERKWNTLPLGQLSNMVRGPFGSALKKEFFVPQSKDTYKVYEQKHAIQKDDKIGDYYISKEKFEELRRFEVFSGDIIMSCSGTIGEFFEIPQGACRGVMNQALLKFKLNEALINKDYFLFVMQYVKKNFTVHGSGLQNIGSVKVIKSVRIGVPSLDLQSCFSQRLRAINETKILIKQSIKEVETLFNSRMDYYFN